MAGRFQNAFYLNTCPDTIDERCPARVECYSETLPAESIYKSRFRANRLKRSACHARNFGDLSSVTRRQRQLRKVNLFQKKSMSRRFENVQRESKPYRELEFFFCRSYLSFLCLFFSYPLS
ncbi:hypothetical protein PUN28_018026 [Cardiocondyla obscurior]|uniref:Uncharacterized protein n=1 Tax=Cardiocondyla obscurior TaxID=286306 RepID=A0AAW2EGH9_9HYME